MADDEPTNALDSFIDAGRKDREEAVEKAAKELAKAQESVQSDREDYDTQQGWDAGWEQVSVVLDRIVGDYGTGASLRDVSEDDRIELAGLLNDVGFSNHRSLNSWLRDLGTTGFAPQDWDISKVRSDILGEGREEVWPPEGGTVTVEPDASAPLYATSFEVGAGTQAALDAAEELVASTEADLTDFNAAPVYVLAETGVVTPEMLPKEERPRFEEEAAAPSTFSPEAGRVTPPATAVSTPVGDVPSSGFTGDPGQRDTGSTQREPVTGSNVLAVQTALAAAGFSPGKLDGVMGPKTRAAIKAYQAANGLTVDGIVGKNTAASLSSVPVATSVDPATGGGGAAIGQGEMAATGGTGEAPATTSVDTVETIVDPVTTVTTDTTGSVGDSTSDGTVPSGDVFTDEEVAALASAYGYGARWLLDEELGPILRQAASEGWYDSATGLARLEAAIKETDWWGAHDKAERDFQLLESSDPATAADHLDNQVVRLTRAAVRIGLTIDTERMRELARDSYVEGWSDYEVNQYVVMEADWATGQAGGQVGDMYSVIDQIAGDYMAGHLIDDETKDAWAEALFLGDETELGLRNDIAQIAQSAFPALDARIAQGYTVKQILAPMRMEAARLLEIDSTSIDFMTDVRFQPIIHQLNDDGTERMMTVSEVGQYVRGLEDYKITDGAKGEAQQLADAIGKKFGRIG
jgi:peptidoglycan hydrolase-like protein with peptidoglycan-binding domain